MKKLFGLIVLVLIANMGFSQSPLPFNDYQLNGAISINNSDNAALIGGIDYAVEQNLTVGAIVGLGNDFFAVGGNANYHFDQLFELPSEWNVYGGATLSFITLGAGGLIDLGLQMGGRYFFNENVGLNLELGAGTELSGGKIGITYIP